MLESGQACCLAGNTLTMENLIVRPSLHLQFSGLGCPQAGVGGTSNTSAFRYQADINQIRKAGKFKDYDQFNLEPNFLNPVKNRDLKA